MRHHGHQDLRLGDARGIAREQRLDVERPIRLDDKIHLIARDVDARQLLHHFVDLGDHDARLEGGCLDDRRRVFGIWSGIEISGSIGLNRRDQGDVRRQVHEIAREQLDVGVHRPEFDLTGGKCARDRLPLWSGIGKIQPARDAALKQVKMRLQHDSGLHDVQIVDARFVDTRQGLGKKIRLLLVVPLEADTVTGPNDRFEQCLGIFCRDQLAVCVFTRGFQPTLPFSALFPPLRHACLPEPAHLQE